MADGQESIEQAATTWLMALNDAPGDRALRESLAVWLAADPAHRKAYDELRRVWLLTGLLPPAADEARASQAGPCAQE